MTTLNGMRPIHPGEILREEFLKELNLTPRELAEGIGMDILRITGLLEEKDSLTPRVAVLLSKFLGTTPEFWLNLQISYEIKVANEDWKDDLAKVKPLGTKG
jgi:addiction module HigA family antidote